MALLVLGCWYLTTNQLSNGPRRQLLHQRIDDTLHFQIPPEGLGNPEIRDDKQHFQAMPKGPGKPEIGGDDTHQFNIPPRRVTVAVSALYQSKPSGSSKDSKRVSTKLSPEQTFSKSNNVSLLYLVQTASCLSDYLLHQGNLGDSSVCDVLVFSYRKLCRRNRQPHVAYITVGHRTSWSVGRNILYDYVRKIRKRYLYYNFLDEDVKFAYTDQGMLKTPPSEAEISATPPLRMYEQLLMRHRPAVARPLYSLDTSTHPHPNDFNACCRGHIRVPLVDRIPASHFDASFVSIHYNALRHLLPYELRYEKQSYWVSQQYFEVKSYLMFRGQVVKFSKIIAANPRHDFPMAFLIPYEDVFKEVLMSVPTSVRKSEIGRLSASPFCDKRAQFHPDDFQYLAPPNLDVSPFKYSNKIWK